MKLFKRQVDTGILIISTLAIFLGISALLTQPIISFVGIISVLLVVAAAGLLLHKKWAPKLYIILAAIYLVIGLIFFLIIFTQPDIVQKGQPEDIAFLPIVQILIALEVVYFIIGIVYLCKPNVKELYK